MPLWLKYALPTIAVFIAIGWVYHAGSISGKQYAEKQCREVDVPEAKLAEQNLCQKNTDITVEACDNHDKDRDIIQQRLDDTLKRLRSFKASACVQTPDLARIYNSRAEGLPVPGERGADGAGGASLGERIAIKGSEAKTVDSYYRICRGILLKEREL